MPITTDAEAKAALRNWPSVGTKLWPGSVPGSAWLRAQPVFGSGPTPKLYQSGADGYATQPDGLYVCLAPAPEDLFADIVAIEVCGSMQNFNDKRARYAPSTVSQGLWCALSWLLRTMPTRGGGSRERWRLAGTFKTAPTTDAWLPIRFMRVIYFLRDAAFVNWRRRGVPQAHEFVSRYKSLTSYTSQTMQDFLKHMTLGAHFYPRGNL
jgi:hypothetical protein